VAFQAIKQAIANNAIASPDPNRQYHLAVDASKRGIGGVLFQLDGVEARTEAGSNSIHRVAERIIMFIFFRLSDTERRYSNSEREALAVIRCLAEVWWMVMASKHLVMVYTDHEALKTLLTGLDNNAHGRIAKWQERLSEYDIKLLHGSAKVHFMGIADGLSRLPTRLLATHTGEDSEGLRPYMNGIVPVSRLVTDVVVNSTLAISLRTNYKFWAMESGEQDEVRGRWTVKNMWEGGEVFVGTSGLEEAGIGQAMGGKMGLEMRRAAAEMRRTRWEKWLKSGMYGTIVQARLDELEDGIMGAKQMEMGRSERRVLERNMRRYVMIDGREPGLFFREKNGEPASCILEKDVRKVLNDLHEGHGHFASRITLGHAHGKVYWPSRANDIGRWVASCESCQRVSKIQRAGQLRSIIQFKPMDMIGMDFVGPINPSYQSTGFIYILIVVDYFSRFLWAVGVERADQTSTIKALLTEVIPVVGWLLTVYTDNGSHFTGSLIIKMWSDHGVLHFPSAISRPQSVRLSERYVQMLVGRIGLSCISQGSAACWAQEIRNAVLSINTRWIRVHGFTRAEILLGFNPAITRKSDTGIDDWWKPSFMEAGDIREPVEDSTKGYMDIREEQRNTMGRRLAHHQDGLQSRKTVGYVTPKVGELVLLRDHQLAKNKG